MMVSRVPISKVVFGIARMGVSSSFINDYRLSLADDDGCRCVVEGSSRGLTVLTFVVIPVVVMVITARVIVIIARDRPGITVPLCRPSDHHSTVSLILRRDDVTLDRDGGTRLVPVWIGGHE